MTTRAEAIERREINWNTKWSEDCGEYILVNATGCNSVKGSTGYPAQWCVRKRDIGNYALPNKMPPPFDKDSVMMSDRYLLQGLASMMDGRK